MKILAIGADNLGAGFVGTAHHDSRRSGIGVLTEQHMTHAIHITNTGERFLCAPTQNLLAGMEALARTGIPVGCRGGGCGVCKVHIEAGQVRTEKMSRARLSAEEERQGFVLACRSYPTSDLTVRAVDRLAGCIERGVEGDIDERSHRQRAVSFLDAARTSATRPSQSSPPTTTSEESPWR